MFWLSQVGQARTVCCTLRGRKDTGTPEPAEHRDSGTGRTPGLRNRQDAATPERAAAGDKQMRGRPYTGTSERATFCLFNECVHGAHATERHVRRAKLCTCCVGARCAGQGLGGEVDVER